MSLIGDFIENILDTAEKNLLEDAKELERFEKILALSVVWDNKIHEDELKESLRIINQSLSNQKYSATQIEIVEDAFEKKVKLYGHAPIILLQDKKWLENELKAGNVSQAYKDAIKSVITADGYISEQEIKLANLIKN